MGGIVNSMSEKEDRTSIFREGEKLKHDLAKSQQAFVKEGKRVGSVMFTERYVRKQREV